MAKNFNELRREMSAERRTRNAAAADRMLLEMTLQKLRQDIANLSQEDVAEMLRVTQGYISKLERQDDMLLGKLYAYVEALGGEGFNPALIESWPALWCARRCRTRVASYLDDALVTSAQT